MPTVDISIKRGKLTMEVGGAKGDACMKLVGDFLDKLRQQGVKIDSSKVEVVLKPEYYLTENEGDERE